MRRLTPRCESRRRRLEGVRNARAVDSSPASALTVRGSISDMLIGLKSSPGRPTDLEVHHQSAFCTGNSYKLLARSKFSASMDQSVEQTAVRGTIRISESQHGYVE
jgi:hypothetical protein